MRLAIKVVLLYLTKYRGGFAVARWMTRRQLRVLCYRRDRCAGASTGRRLGSVWGRGRGDRGSGTVLGERPAGEDGAPRCVTRSVIIARFGFWT